MTIKSTFHGGSCPKETLSGSGSSKSTDTPTRSDDSDPNSPSSSPVMTKKSGAEYDDDVNDDIPALIVTPNSTAHTQSSDRFNGSNSGLDEDATEDILPNAEKFLSKIGVPLLIEKPSDSVANSFIPPCRPLNFQRHGSSDSSIYFSSTGAVSSSSTFACLDNLSDDASSHSISSSSASNSSASSSASSFPSSGSDSDSSVMSSDSSSSASLISNCSSLSADINTSDNGASGGSTSLFGSLIPSSSNTSSSGVGMKQTSKAWLRRRERMQARANSTTRKIDRRVKMKLRSRDRFLQKLAMKDEADYQYLKENETRARSVARGTGAVAPRGLCHEARRHILFEMFYSLPAAITMLTYCCTHVAIYELVQIAVADCLELNEYYNQNLVYICVFAVAVLMARTSGSLYEFTSDDAYNRVKFDMNNKLKLGDFDARILRRVKKYPTVKLLLDVTALYLTYISANHFITETMLKTFFDKKEAIVEDLPSMKYPGISTQISNILLHGEKMFEDPSVVLGQQTSAASSTACAILGGDLCDERVFQACSAFDELRANLTVADGVYLYDEVSFNTYYKIIGDTSAGVYYYETAMAALLVCSIVGSVFLRKRGVGFWE